MNPKIYLYILSSILLITSCLEEDYFGKSSYANIKKIVVSNQSGNSIINNDNATITIEIPGGVDLSQIVIKELEISSFSTSNLQVGDTINLTNDAIITLSSENGTIRNWTIQAFVASSTPQLNNYQLNQWYKTVTGYYEPGESPETTIWSTGNRGTQLLNKLATTPIDLGDGNIAAQMETLDNGRLGALVGTPISAGSLFTGYFNPDKISPTNPQAAIEFGTPFAGRPTALRFKYKYTAGEVNKDKSGNVLNFPDQCDIYALLEVRIDGKIERLATAWFRSNAEENAFITQEIPFIYGPLDHSFPEYMHPANGEFVTAESAQFMLPTHITFVASSSFDGANFAGAIGSTLVIDDIEMVYE